MHTLNQRNEFGKLQSDIDIEANKIITKHLEASQVVAACASEEVPEKTILNENGSYFVTFDPIDGSSVIECNFSVGSIFGIWATQDVEGKTGR